MAHTKSPALKDQKETYYLPPALCGRVGNPGLRFELHAISFSHYCDRARWSLRLLDIPYEETGRYLPLSHMLPMIWLLRRFRQAPGPSTASSKSPAATPCLAIYDSQGQPICLLQNSTLISRFAALHKDALLSKKAQHSSSSSMYGCSLALAEDGCSITGSGELYEEVAELELRLSNIMGVEARRIIYHHLLPQQRLTREMFRRNSEGSQQLLSGLIAYLSKVALPKLLKVNADTAATAKQRLLEEFDFFDQLLQQRATAAATPGTAGSFEAALGGAALGCGGQTGQALPFYLCGQSLTAADVSLATLAGPLLGLREEGLTLHWLPALSELPQPLREISEGLRARPTGQFAIALWRCHGPVISPALV